ncbi:MAG: S46 family peptidase [Acidobacteriota bacterium]|nr:S46 family peptidase [Acidobacteriota bacterium]
MKRLIPILVLLLVGVAAADEGMWPPHQLPELGDELKRLGLKLDPRSLSDLTAHPMNAVISLGGCTASFVSPDGLVVTNHHCAYGAIQYNSTEDENLLQDGFLAKERTEERFAGPGSRVLVTVEVEDVTDRVTGSLPDGVTGKERYDTIEARQKALVAECEKDEGHRCRVSAFYGGLEYQLIKQLEIKDVRLVYAPAGSIGKYGGDIDNWMWPRHTGDYSFYRAYVDPDGRPADHAAENVPFRPRHWLRVQPKGVSAGDFVMVIGYPGGTSRYRIAREAKSTIEWRYPTLKRVFGAMLAIIEQETSERPDAAIKYASMVAGLNNAAKNYQGMLDGFAKSDILERKAALQQQLDAWIAADPDRKARYGSAIADLRALVEKNEATRDRDVYYGFLGRRSSLLSVASQLYRLSRERTKPDLEREPGYQERDWPRIAERMKRMERTFDPGVDRALWRHGLLAYAAIPTDQHVAEYDTFFGIEGTTIDPARLDELLDKMYAGTKLGETETRLAWSEKDAAAFEESDDPFIRLAVHMYDVSRKMEDEDEQLVGELQRARPRYMEVLIAFLGSRGKAVYPDANGTLRVTVGSVKGYSPKDALSYTPFTTLRGIVEKDTGEDPFDSPKELLAAIGSGARGRYAVPSLGSVPVNFLSTVDTTGGNSGSPTVNARAELVGLLFDGNYESINSDWDFNPDVTRSIHVDIRYVLWIMDTIDGAQHLLEEMGVSSTESRKAAAR